MNGNNTPTQPDYKAKLTQDDGTATTKAEPIKNADNCDKKGSLTTNKSVLKPTPKNQSQCEQEALPKKAETCKVCNSDIVKKDTCQCEPPFVVKPLSEIYKTTLQDFIINSLIILVCIAYILWALNDLESLGNAVIDFSNENFGAVTLSGLCIACLLSNGIFLASTDTKWLKYWDKTRESFLVISTGYLVILIISYFIKSDFTGINLVSILLTISIAGFHQLTNYLFIKYDQKVERDRQYIGLFIVLVLLILLTFLFKTFELHKPLTELVSYLCSKFD